MLMMQKWCTVGMFNTMWRNHLTGSCLLIFMLFYYYYYQGTEVKAITYSNMQVHDNDDKHEVYVIIDI